MKHTPLFIILFSSILDVSNEIYARRTITQRELDGSGEIAGAINYTSKFNSL